MRESKREGIDVSADHIALMNGSMQAVTLVAEALMEGPGGRDRHRGTDVFLGRLARTSGWEPSWSGCRSTSRALRVDVLADVLADLRRKGTPAALYLYLGDLPEPHGLGHAETAPPRIARSGALLRDHCGGRQLLRRRAF